MEDDAHPHRAYLVEVFLEEEGTFQMEWPAKSFDLNPIEHVWNAPGRTNVPHQYVPNTHQTLKSVLIEEWLLPQDEINNLLCSM
ncbi:DDE_3 domain-containing protein [Trichonephila clavipes]|nr:DDE_3 domain-containing protein [Trichonephila clavipes]